MCVFLAGGVYAQVAGNAGLVVAHITPPPLTMRVSVCRWCELGGLGGRRGKSEWELVCGLFHCVTVGGAAIVGNVSGVHVTIRVSPILNVIKVFIRLHVYAEVAFRRGSIVTHLAAVGLVATGVGFTAGQARMGFPRTAISTHVSCCTTTNTLSPRGAAHTLASRLWMFLFHVDLQCMLRLIVPVTLGAFQRLAGIA